MLPPKHLLDAIKAIDEDLGKQYHSLSLTYEAARLINHTTIMEDVEEELTKIEEKLAIIAKQKETSK
jgi:hypothetical protein